MYSLILWYATLMGLTWVVCVEMWDCIRTQAKLPWSHPKELISEVEIEILSKYEMLDTLLM